MRHRLSGISTYGLEREMSTPPTLHSEYYGIFTLQGEYCLFRDTNFCITLYINMSEDVADGVGTDVV